MQVEEGRKVEKGMNKIYIEKEDQCQRLEAEVSIIKGKLIEKEKTHSMIIPRYCATTKSIH